MVQAMDQAAIVGAMVGACDGSVSKKERWMVRAVDQGAIEGAIHGSSDRPESNTRSDGWYKRLFRDQ